MAFELVQVHQFGLQGHHQGCLEVPAVVAGVPRVQGEDILRRAQDRHVQSLHLADCGLADDHLLRGPIVPGEDDDRAETVAHQFGAQTGQPRFQQVRGHGGFGFHDDGVRLIDPADSAEQRRQDHPGEALGRLNAERVSFHGIQTQGVLASVPLESPDGNYRRRAALKRSLKLEGEHEFVLDHRRHGTPPGDAQTGTAASVFARGTASPSGRLGRCAAGKRPLPRFRPRLAQPELARRLVVCRPRPDGVAGRLPGA